MAKTTKYYFYSNKHQGQRYFKVDPFKDVIQVVVHTQPKKGRPFMKGITLMKYLTFLQSWGWKMEESIYLKEITKKEYEKAFAKILKKLEK
jgi:hypothetical protein